MPFVLAYSGGSAGEWLILSGTPLPYQALSGTLIRYAIVKNTWSAYHKPGLRVKRDCNSKSPADRTHNTLPAGVSRKTLAVTVPHRHIVFAIPKIYSNIFTSRIGEKGRVSWFMNAL